MTRSHRTSSEQELIGWNDDQAMIQGEIAKGSSTLPLEILLSKKAEKPRSTISNKKVKYLRGTNECHFICTRGSFVSKGSPQIRRKFLDMELGQINPIYLYDLVQYQAILKQRNQYLKQLNEKTN